MISPPHLSLDVIVSALACLCPPQPGIDPRSDGLAGLRNLTGEDRGDCLQMLTARMDTMERQLTSIEEMQAKTLYMLEKQQKQSDMAASPVVEVAPPTLHPCANISAARLSIELVTIGAATFNVHCAKSPPSLATNDQLVIQDRKDGSVNFNRNWPEYREGFGRLDGEFFLGLEKIHLLTNEHEYGLLIFLEDFENATRFARYESFVVGDEKQRFGIVQLGAYSGNAGNSFSPEFAGMKFSTPDLDNDLDEVGNCAQRYKGGWWYDMCLSSNLNGEWREPKASDNQWMEGLVWKGFRGLDYSLKATRMALVRKP